jgi:hypothetical protein
MVQQEPPLKHSTTIDAQSYCKSIAEYHSTQEMDLIEYSQHEHNATTPRSDTTGAAAWLGGGASLFRPRQRSLYNDSIEMPQRRASTFMTGLRCTPNAPKTSRNCVARQQSAQDR